MRNIKRRLCLEIHVAVQLIENVEYVSTSLKEIKKRTNLFRHAVESIKIKECYFVVRILKSEKAEQSYVAVKADEARLLKFLQIFVSIDRSLA
jgi:hypothetical protein